MDVFNVISLLGGLAMFLYGMRLMGDSLKENSSGTLKKAMSKVTNNPLKAFVLGVLVTALIQSLLSLSRRALSARAYSHFVNRSA